MRRRDFFFGAGVVLFVVICFFLRGLLYGDQAVYVEISQDGSLIRREKLSDLEGQELRIESADGGFNLIDFQEGAVWVKEADCENGDCIRQGMIRRTGESIICLPHKLTVTIGGNVDSADTDGEIYDSIVR